MRAVTSFTKAAVCVAVCSSSRLSPASTAHFCLVSRSMLFTSSAKPLLRFSAAPRPYRNCMRSCLMYPMSKNLEDGWLGLISTRKLRVMSAMLLTLGSSCCSRELRLTRRKQRYVWRFTESGRDRMSCLLLMSSETTSGSSAP